jgi:hypothetical protein
MEKPMRGSGYPGRAMAMAMLPIEDANVDGGGDGRRRRRKGGTNLCKSLQISAKLGKTRRIWQRSDGGETCGLIWSAAAGERGEQKELRSGSKNARSSEQREACVLPLCREASSETLEMENSSFCGRAGYLYMDGFDRSF